MALFAKRSKILALLSFALLFFTAYANALEDAQSVVLEAPNSVNIHQTFPVKFAGPIANGDVIRFADTQGKALGGSYAYAGNAKGGAVILTAPVDPGAYQVIYLSQNEIVASKAITVVAVSAQVSGPAETKINEPIQVTFEGPRNKGDYLQVTDAAGKPPPVYTHT